MKKKIYLIISSIIGMVLSFYSLITLNIEETIKYQLETFNKLFDNNIPESFLNIINNHAQYYVTIIIGIILFAIILIITIKGNISKNKTALIILSILLVLFSDQILLGLINIIVLSTVKKFNTPKEKEQLPILEEPKRDKITKIKSVSIILFYFFIMFIFPEIIDIFIKNFSLHLTMLFNIIIDLILLILVFFLFFPDIQKQLKIFGQKIKLYLPKIFLAYAISLLLMLGTNIIIMIIKGDVQESVNQLLLNQFPFWFLFLTAVIYAPIVEETVFRYALRNIINSDKIFIIISAISFGLLHTIGQEATIFDTILLAIPYMAMGYVLAKTYVKTNNITSNMTLHALNNLIAVIVLAII